ncbi:hypothetical protein BKA61DRAFT_582456 [Leptodontidium sp. MPI-SDFR-AT-0119]|nr:hypothetical protein BKA61DRAFT_582456 [Leptodontidium sp. MPI-SDFR-AT-0119]
MGISPSSASHTSAQGSISLPDDLIGEGMSEPSHTIDTPTRTFFNFPELPMEIQLQIWQHAVPEIGSVLGVIRIILDFDLSKPRAILPSIREFKESYRSINYPGYDPDEDSEEIYDNDDDNCSGTEEFAIWRSSNTTVAASRRPVFALLHTCRTARLATLERYRLAIGSGVEGENKPWWVPKEDMVIFASSGYRERLTWVHWLFRSRDEPLPVFESLEHLALANERNMDDYLIPATLYGELLLNFPALESFTLLLDPVFVLDRQAGRVLLHEPEQTSVVAFGGFRPAEIEKRVTSAFEEEIPEDREVPLVEVFVAGWKKG